MAEQITSRKSSSKPKKTPQISMAASLAGLDAVGQDPALASLLAVLNEDTSGAAGLNELNEEVIEPAGGVVAAPVNDADEVLAQIEAMDAAAGLKLTPDSPEELGAEVPATPAAATPAAEAAGAEPPAAAVSPKRTPVPRKHYTNKADRIADRLGDKLGEYTLLTATEAGIAIEEGEEALKALSAATMATIRKMNKKEQNRASLFMEFVSGKKGKLNEVLERCLKLLHKDGKITTGKDGNLLADLLARPYSPAAARAMGGNTVGMFEDLKVLVKDGKGSFLPNPDSLLLAKANALLGLSTSE